MFFFLSLILLPMLNGFIFPVTVLKFGGTSIGSPERIKGMSKIIKNEITKGKIPAVVCSAIGNTTNELINVGKNAMNGHVCISDIVNNHQNVCTELELPGLQELDLDRMFIEIENVLFQIKKNKKITPRLKDKLSSYGELMSIRIISGYLNKIGIESKFIDNIGIITDEGFGNAKILPETYSSSGINDNIRKNEYTTIIPGFIGSTSKKEITTLGRSGSDLSASVIAKACNASEIQFFKDVNGIMTCDPRIIKNSKSISDLTYEEASEMANFGAEVLHPSTMDPLIESNIPVRIRNSFNPSHIGTSIRNKRINDNLVTSLTIKDEVNLIDIVSSKMVGTCGFLKEIFEIFDKHQISIDMISTSEKSISLTLDLNQNQSIVKESLNEIGNMYEIVKHQNVSIISLISDLSKSSIVISKVFNILEMNNINVLMMSLGASKVNIGLVVNKEDGIFALKILHDFFFE